MSSPVASIGVDVGGTWLRLVALDEEGAVVANWKRPAPDLKTLPTVLSAMLRRFKGAPNRLLVASKGIWSTQERNALKKQLQKAAQRVVVVSDVEAAWWASFGALATTPTAKILILSGTGSIALGARNGSGPWFRRGGLGPLLGDEGSGFWIGREWLRAKGVARAKGFSRPSVLQKREVVRQVASYAPSVLRAARQGSHVAQAILRQAQMHLAQLVIDLTKDMKVRSELLCSASGTLLQNEFFLRPVKAMVKKPLRGLRVEWVSPRVTAATAMAHLGFGYGH